MSGIKRIISKTFGRQNYGRHRIIEVLYNRIKAELRGKNKNEHAN